MDLLDSILDSMDKSIVQKPLSSQERELREKQKQQKRAEQEAQQKWIEHIRAKLKQFAESSEDQTRTYFQPVVKAFRHKIHEEAELIGLVSHSFGRDEAFRYTFVFKKDFAPSLTQLKEIEYRCKDGMSASEIESTIESVQKKCMVDMLEEPGGSDDEDEEKKLPQITFNINTSPSTTSTTPTSINRPHVPYKTPPVYSKVTKEEDTFIVLGTKKRDRRTIEEIQADMKRNKLRRVLSNQSNNNDSNDNDNHNGNSNDNDNENSDNDNDNDSGNDDGDYQRNLDNDDGDDEEESL